MCGSLKKSSFAIPQAIKDYFQTYGGNEMGSRSLRLLGSAESARLVDNWLRYGLPSERQYLPIAEEENGDLLCVACAEHCHGQIFLVPWSGEEEYRFASVNDFIDAHIKLQNVTACRSAH